MKNYLQMFERYLVDRKAVSANTLESYLRDVRQYLEHIDEDVLGTDEITVESYVIHLKDMNKSPATVTRMVASIRAFYQFLVIEGLMDENPAKAIKLERTEKTPPQVLSSKEVLTLLSMPNPSELKGARDKAMLELLYATGIRVSELINLDVSNVRNAKNSRKEIICNGSKGTRTLPMHIGAS
ncbi:MAG: site-specific integrase, partial [Oscillospiraceae bacterium]|nr:site-specific integrase [Oscillospiraceae bacterium]